MVTAPCLNLAHITLPLLSLTLWYPRHMLQLRIALFWGGSTVAGISAFVTYLSFHYLTTVIVRQVLSQGCSHTP